MKKIIQYFSFKNERGVTLALVALLLFVFLGVGALVVDLGLLYAARNELQNASDAGALAGARVLYNMDGSVNNVANQVACEAAKDNKALTGSGVIAVDVNWGDGECNGNDNEGDVQRGHWSFGSGTFTKNDSLEPVDLWDRSTESLDSDINFINAVKVTARRQSSPVSSFFARIFGRESFELSAEAIAYIGFASSLMPEEADQPVAICKQSIVNEDGNYTCGVGRMMTDSDAEETAAWTNFEQPTSSCTGGANASTIRPLVCASGNPNPIIFGKLMDVINGQVHSAFSDFWDCWWNASEGGTKPWAMTLPVIECQDGGKVRPCEKVLGAVKVNIIWVNDKANKNQMDGAPSNHPSDRPGGPPLSMAGFGEGSGKYDSWSTDADDITDSDDGEQRWKSFVNHFNLQLNTEDPIEGWTQKTIYFVPSCDYHEPSGVTGGENFGILAKIPVLVN